jgi:ABC-2 type transport system permease protein
MKYAYLVAWREFTENIKTKGFWIGIFLFPTILFLSIQIPVFLEKKGSPIRYYVLVDQSGNLAPVILSRLEWNYQWQMLNGLDEYARDNSTASSQTNGSPLNSFNSTSQESLDAFIKKGGKDFFLEQLKPFLKSNAPPFQEPRRFYQPVNLPAGVNTNGDLASLARDLKPYLRGEKKIDANGWQVELSAAILIPRDIEKQIVRPQAGSARNKDNTNGIEYWSVNLAETKLSDEVEAAVSTEIRRREFLARGMDSALVGQVEQTYLPFSSLNPKKEAGQETVNDTDKIRQWAPSGFVYLLWVAIFAIVQMLLNNIIEEKSNRIIEVLLSSVTPGELMMGKLLGIAAVGLTMVGAWMLALFGILSWKAGGAGEITGQILTVVKTSNLVPMFSIYFLLGYFLYAALILSLGSVCNTLKEAQSYMGVITMLMMVPMMTMMFIPKDPNGVLARVLSWIPIYTPFTMMNRANADPPLVDLIGTLVLLVVCTSAALWMAGKIFRIGILRTGQPPKIIEMLRWLKG